MSRRPRIALPTPTSADLEYNRVCLTPYVAALEASGAEVLKILLPATETVLRHALDSMDGVLLPGSPADVDPRRYGQTPHPATAPADFPREEVDHALLEHAQTTEKPVLGICYGLQSINTWRGGSLVQDLTVLPVPHTAGPAVGIAHAAVIEQDTLLGDLVDPSEAPTAADRFLRLPVNSSHHQAVGIPGDNLRVTGRCPQDGVVESIEGDASLGFPLLAVQWHPERSYSTSATSRALFRWLIEQAAERTTCQS